MQPRNNSFFVFMLAAFGFMMLWASFHNWMYPPIERPEEKTADKITVTSEPAPGLVASFANQARTRTLQLAEEARRAAERLLQLTTPQELVGLGSDAPDSPFHLGVKLDPLGAGVRSVILNKFRNQDEDGKPAPGVFHLIPDDVNGGMPDVNGGVPANLLYHYTSESAPRPSDELGRVKWEPVTPKPEEQTLDDGRLRQTFRFRKTLNGIEIVKTYSLTAGEYHLGLTLEFTRRAAPENFTGKRLPTFRYQLAGARGLPIEGKWYTSTFRNALIAQDDKGTIYRDFQDSRQIGVWGGGQEFSRDPRDPGKFFRYAGVAVQYFASVVVIDDQQSNQAFIARVRPTLETSVTRGSLVSVATDRKSFKLLSAHKEHVFQVDPDNIRVLAVLEHRKPDDRLAVTSFPDRHGNFIAERVTAEFASQALWEDDITVRLNSEPFELDIDKSVTHKFLLYNGPVKPSLLGMMSGDDAVPPAVVDRYLNNLHLNTLTDYQFPGWIGSFSNSIYWTHIVIKTTNLLHWILNIMYSWVGNYGICIILLTVLVRGIMFPLSRKQAMMALKMQALAPELKALQAKYGEDRQGFAMAQMALFRKHGVNPFGTCWVILLQMPIFMGLWYALQESLFFRLASFWPTWIVNLSAPDLLLNWGRGIPLLSRDVDYGGFLYLGPYLNVLPIAAIVLMVVQQKLMSPPATDEQMEANQRVMTIMMCVMGLLFYKVAAGLCIYFIATSVWGLAERALLPKPTKPGEGPSNSPATTPALALATERGGTNVTTPVRENSPTRQEPRGRNKKARKGRRPEQPTQTAAQPPEEPAEEQPGTLLGRFRSWWRARRKRLGDWWAEVLRQAEKK